MDNAIIQALRNRVGRLTSLSTPQDADAADVIADIGAGFVPGVGTALSARDFERARREGDRLGMVLSAAGTIPIVGGVARAAGKARKGTKAADAAVEALRATPTSTAAKEYAISHRPMTVEGGAARLHDLVPSFGDDIYGKNALQYFGSGDTRERSMVQTLQALRGKPDQIVTIYRGVPGGAGQINAGDWVTLDPRVASDYGNVISQQVPASHITSWPDSLLEFGYYPPQK